MNKTNVAEIISDIEKLFLTFPNNKTSIAILPFEVEPHIQKKVSVEAFKRGLVLKFNSNSQVQVIALSSFQLSPNRIMPHEAQPIPQSEEISGDEDPKEVVPGFESYTPPKDLVFAEALLRNPDRTVNLWFYGPSACGKTTAAKYLAKKLNRKLFKINCDGNSVTASHFFGTNTVVIDKETGKNKVVYVDGVVVQAMKEGLDAEGNVCGEPGILFIDEAASIPPSVGITLNAMLETRDQIRSITLAEDGGRIVNSHPGFKVILAGNTNGLGASSESQQQYSAQRRALDASMIQRITATFRFGYDKKAEENIIFSKKFSPDLVTKFLQLKSSIRKAMKDGNIMTPFSTSKVIDICDITNQLLESSDKDTYGSFAKAFKYCYLESILPDERLIAETLFQTSFGISISEDGCKKDDDSNYDYI